MPITLPTLPYAKNALAPHISEETINFHYGKHHQAYVNKLNGLVDGTKWETASLENMIMDATDAVFNNAAQVWNHTFYWNCLSPNGGGEPPKDIADALEKSFSSLAEFKEKMTKAALGQFGSGWAWLAQKANGSLIVQATQNANNPMQEGLKPLLTCDVWEHAYYIDYRNARPKYIEAFWNLINWDFVAKNLQNK